MMPEHSPLPWEFDNRISRLSVIAANGDLIAERIPGCAMDLNNFLLIVTAVNSHDRLIAAAKQAQLVLTSQSSMKTQLACASVLRMAIAAAEELAP